MLEKFLSANQIDMIKNFDETFIGNIEELDKLDQNKLNDLFKAKIGYGYIDIREIETKDELMILFDEVIEKEYLVMPFLKENNFLQIAMKDPFDINAIDQLNRASGCELALFFANENDLKECINKFYDREMNLLGLGAVLRETSIDEEDVLSKRVEKEIMNEPIVKVVDTLIRQGIMNSASDIHIEPQKNILKIRYRMDGDLITVAKLSMAIHNKIVTRIKILADLDIAEKRMPQDGRIGFDEFGDNVDLRISTIYTVYGEKIVIRILNRELYILDKKELGFFDSELDKFNAFLKAPYGMILVTGPTGSGKTTTLYASLKELNKNNKNILTIEDPVEFKMTGVNQININKKVGINFSNGLRSILRQDPDIIMIGEIRDSETAKIGVRAAITGHLVLSTMHTNDALSAIVRLKDMGVEEYLIQNALVGVIGQRLLKKICPYCKTSYIANKETMELLGLKEEVVLNKGLGCEKCNFTGYIGRIAVYEILNISNDLRRLIVKGFQPEQLRETLKEESFVSLSENCKRLVLKGVTSIDEMIKVTYRIDN